MNLIKKAALTLMILSIFILPAGGAGERSVQSPGFVPGSVPAGSGMAESMAPALHGMVLAMLNREASAFDPADRELAWESLYNMLSLYGQMDSRSITEQGELFLEALGERPASLADRLRFDRRAGSYTLACGSDDLAQLQLFEVRPDGAGFQLTGALVYLVDGSELVRFQAGLQPQDTMFGCAVTSLQALDFPAGFVYPVAWAEGKPASSRHFQYPRR